MTFALGGLMPNEEFIVVDLHTLLTYIFLCTLIAQSGGPSTAKCGGFF